ncbi:MAG: DoxX family protein [Flavobacteriaceae bacterium]|nr:DoxX family protein [Flavobacteriaceae bacterium]
MAKTNAIVVSAAALSFYCCGFSKFNFVMRLLDILILISSISFLIYGISWFTSPHMKSEFKRFGLEKFGLLTVVLEIAGALGLLVGLFINFILLISSGGLALLMFLGFLTRLRVKDSLWVSLPALFYLVLNSYIFFESMKIFLD